MAEAAEIGVTEGLARPSGKTLFDMTEHSSVTNLTV